MESMMQTAIAKLMMQNSRTLDRFKLLTNEEQVEFTMNFIHDITLLESLPVTIKDSRVSVELRNQANKLYTSPKQSHQLDEIIELYTKSAAYAPDASEELSIAFANRSAALFKGRLYDECLKDIKRALDLNYPDNLKAKLLARKAQCLVVLGAPTQEVEETVQEGRKWLDEMDKTKQGRKLIETILNNTINKRDFPEQRVLLDDERNLPAILDENPEVRGLSPAAEIEYSKKFGRHVVAKRNITVGEVIGIEMSYVSVLETEKLYTHCSNCLKRTWSGIPCKFCTEVIYCSEKCLEEAWEDHHDMECQLLQFKKQDTLKMTFFKHLFLSLRLCVRALKEAGNVENLREALRQIDSHQVPETKRFTNDVPGDKNFAHIYVLETHADKRSPLDSFYMSTIYSYLLQMLANKNSLMFGKQLGGNLRLLAQDPSVTFIGGLIIRSMHVAASNAYEIAEASENQTIIRGSGLFSSFCYFNHSCNPNCCVRNTLGRTMILHANSAIKKGEQIFVTYGPDFAYTEKAERQEKLMSYFFNCECNACINDWPIMEKLPILLDLKLPAEIKLQGLIYLEEWNKYAEIVNYNNGINIDKKILNNFAKIMKFFLTNLPVFSQSFHQARFGFASIQNRQGNLMQTLNQFE